MNRYTLRTAAIIIGSLIAVIVLSGLANALFELLP